MNSSVFSKTFSPCDAPPRLTVRSKILRRYGRVHAHRLLFRDAPAVCSTNLKPGPVQLNGVENGFHPSFRIRVGDELKIKKFEFIRGGGGKKVEKLYETDGFRRRILCGPDDDNRIIISLLLSLGAGTSRCTVCVCVHCKENSQESIRTARLVVIRLECKCDAHGFCAIIFRQRPFFFFNSQEIDSYVRHSNNA